MLSSCDSVDIVLESLHWLPLDYRINFKVLCLAYMSFHVLARSYLADLIKPYTPKRALHSADQNLFTVPKIRKNEYDACTFEFAAPNLFDSLPEHGLLSPSYDTFKGRLKTHLFQTAFGCIQCLAIGNWQCVLPTFQFKFTAYSISCSMLSLMLSLIWLYVILCDLVLFQSLWSAPELKRSA